MVSVAQFEREMMKERQVEGIKRAQAEGKYKGRVPKAMNQADKVKALVAAGVDRLKIQEQLAMSKASYYRCLKKWCKFPNINPEFKAEDDVKTRQNSYLML